MVRVTIFYPSKPGARFDAEYYIHTHMPLAMGALGPAIKGVSVDIGLIGGTPGEPPPFLAICNFTCETVEAFTAAFLPNADLLQDDMGNFTDIAPVIQVSEIRFVQ